MNFVSKSIGGGFSEYLIKNVPPESSFGLNVTQPAIYFGGGTTPVRGSSPPTSKNSTIHKVTITFTPAIAVMVGSH